MTLPQGPRGRLVALALVLIPVILIARYAAWPLAASLASSGDALEATREEISRYQRLLNELPVLEAAVARLEEERPLAPYLLSGTNRALAAADLQRRLQQAGEKHGVTILSLRVKTAVADGPLERISVEARLRAGIRELRDLLYFVETSTPYLFVEDLGINVRQSRRTRSTTSVLEINLSLYGLRAPDGPEAAGGAHG
jgi:general secretion pathway protein M